MNLRPLRQALVALCVSAVFLGFAGLSGCSNGDVPAEGTIDMSGVAAPGTASDSTPDKGKGKGKAGRNTPQSVKGRALAPK